MIKKITKILSKILIVFLLIVTCGNVYAEPDQKLVSVTGEYAQVDSTGRTPNYFINYRQGTLASISSFKNVMQVPIDEYPFALGDSYDGDSPIVTLNGGSADSLKVSATSEIAKHWCRKKNSSGEYIDITNNENQRNSTCTNLAINKYLAYKTTEDHSQINGKLSARYEKVGKYNGQYIDVVLTVEGYDTIDTNSDREPIIGFFKKSEASNAHLLGIWVAELSWIQIKYDFYKHGTTESVKVKGYTTYWDVDEYQGIDFCYGTDSVSVGNKFYKNSNNPDLYHYEHDENTSGTNKICKGKFVFHNTGGENIDSAAYVDANAITEIFDTKSFTRIFSFANTGKLSQQKEVDDSITQLDKTKVYTATGGIWNDSRMSGGSKTYDKSSKIQAGDVVSFKDLDKNEIVYKISYTNGTNSNRNVTITDNLSDGLVYAGTASRTPSSVSADKKTLSWTINGVEPHKSINFTYKVTVTDTTNSVVNNSVNIKDDGGYDKTFKLTNPVAYKSYASDSVIKSNQSVKKGDKITYSIKYANTDSVAKSVTINDILSKGLKFVTGSAKVASPIGSTASSTGITAIPGTTKSDGSTLITFTLPDIGVNTNGELTYVAEVISDDVSIVKNSAKLTLQDHDTINLGELENPVIVTDGEVKVPNTASTKSIILITLGIVLVGLGGYFVYKKYYA